MIVPILAFYIGQEYQTNRDYSNLEGGIKIDDQSVNIEGIDPYSILNAPAPDVASDTSDATNTLTLKDENGDVIYFDKGSVDLESSSGKNGLSGNYYMNLQLLGYARMGGIPTAIALISEKNGGTGYFPSLVLYQARDARPHISQILPLRGDRITIESLLIKDDLISLRFLSWGEQTSTSNEYRFTENKLVEVR